MLLGPQERQAEAQDRHWPPGDSLREVRALLRLPRGLRHSLSCVAGLSVPMTGEDRGIQACDT